MAERHLAKNPDDVKGWTVLAGVYGRTNRPADKARALTELIRLSGPNPELLTDLGEALTVAAGEIVPIRARKLFEQALSLDPNYSKASLYLAVAQEQEGKFELALARWQDLAKIRRQDQQWQVMTSTKIAELRQALNDNSQSVSGPTREDVENASQMSTADRMTMIEGMVSGLAEKLQSEPKNLAGWNRLIRSYSVLGKRDLAREAYQSAVAAFADDPTVIAQLESLAGNLELLPVAPQNGETKKEDSP